ncbi:MAG: EamA family transporter [Alphaproteobacteria bacterium]
MNPVLAGLLSALSLGTADFAGRFATRAWGAPNVLLGVFASSFALLSLWAIARGIAVPELGPGSIYVALNGAATALMTVFLYLSLARGPISVAAPIVASHPAIVLAVWFVLGETPNAYQWLGMSMTIAGAVIAARAADRSAAPAGGLRPTILMAGAACACYAGLVVFGQLAVRHYGPFEALWQGRGVSLAGVLLLMAFARAIGLGAPRMTARAWAPLAGLGVLDAAGYLFLFAGSVGAVQTVAPVVGSAFGAVTVILARVFLREKMGAMQWLGIALVTAGVAILAGKS